MKVKSETIEGKRVHYVECPECGNRLAAIEGHTGGEPISEESFRKALANHLRNAHPKTAKAKAR